MRNAQPAPNSHGRAPSGWRHAAVRLLVLIAIYAAYVPHFSMKVGYIPGGGLQGPIYGWEVLAFGIFCIFLPGPLSHLAFWVGSGLFIAGRLSAARTAGCAAFLLYAVNPLMLPPGLYLGLALPLMSMAALILASMWLERRHRPRQDAPSPQAAH